VRRLIPFLCALVLSQGANAQRSSHMFELSGQFFNFDYSEVWPIPQRSNELGFIPGIALAYTYRGYKVPIYARASFEYSSSQTTYEGDLNHPDGSFEPLIDHSNNHFRRFELQGGYTFRLGRQFTLTPYTGYGYRSWTRILADPGGYEEDYSWSYIPLGVRGDLQLSRTFALGFNAAFRFMFGGSIHMTDFYDDPTMELRSVLGFKISLPSSYRLSQHWSMGIEPWLEYSGIDGSPDHLVAGTTNYYVWEPQSSTSIFGTNITVQYGF
jgi:hypothetical protein